MTHDTGRRPRKRATRSSWRSRKRWRATGPRSAWRQPAGRHRGSRARRETPQRLAAHSARLARDKAERTVLDDLAQPTQDGPGGIGLQLSCAVQGRSNCSSHLASQLLEQDKCRQPAQHSCGNEQIPDMRHRLRWGQAGQAVVGEWDLAVGEGVKDGGTCGLESQQTPTLGRSIATIRSKKATSSGRTRPVPSSSWTVSRSERTQRPQTPR